MVLYCVNCIRGVYQCIHNACHWAAGLQRNILLLEDKAKPMRPRATCGIYLWPRGVVYRGRPMTERKRLSCAWSNWACHYSCMQAPQRHQNHVVIGWLKSFARDRAEGLTGSAAFLTNVAIFLLSKHCTPSRYNISSALTWLAMKILRRLYFSPNLVISNHHAALNHWQNPPIAHF